MKGIIPANINDSWGVLTDYFGLGQQIRTNMALYLATQVPNRPDALLSVDFVTSDVNDGHPLNIECFDCKVVTLKRLSDGKTQGVQMWVQVGNKDQKLNFHPCVPASWNAKAPFVAGDPESYVCFDLDRDGLPDGPENSFRVIIPGDGIPWNWHELYSEWSIVRTWFTEGAERMFWAAWHQEPRLMASPEWTGDTGKSRFSTYYQEAFWQETGGWSFGSGKLVAMPDGALWPAPECQPGSFETHAFGTTPMWWAHVWSPLQWDEWAMRPAR